MKERFPVVQGSSVAETLDRLSAVPIDVPERGKGRTSWHCERHAACRLVATLVGEGVWAPPMELLKGEEPDFLVALGSSRVGVEFTEATQEGFVETLVLPEAQADGSVVDRSLFRVGGPKHRLSARRRIANQKRLTGPGWENDAPECEWTAGVLEALATKTMKLQRYERFDEDWLLVYENLFLPGIDLSVACQLLGSRLAGYWREGVFRTIAIESGNVVLLFDGRGVRQWPVLDLWSKRQPSFEAP